MVRAQSIRSNLIVSKNFVKVNFYFFRMSFFNNTFLIYSYDYMMRWGRDKLMRFLVFTGRISNEFLEQMNQAVTEHTSYN